MVVMTTESAYAGGDPKQALWQARELARGVRRAQRATWFPLLVFAAVTLAAIPVYRYGHFAKTCRGVPAGRVCSIYSSTGFVYWPIALVLAYVAIAAFYLHRSRARGLGTRIRPYVIAGIVLAVALTTVSLWEAHHPPVDPRDFLGLHIGEGFDLVNRLASPTCAIGLALLVLAWAERNRALLLVTVGYLAIVLVPIDFGWVLTRPSPWVFLPHLVIDGGVLLVAGLGFAVAQRPTSRPAP
jgi:hypothetical protein